MKENVIIEFNPQKAELIQLAKSIEPALSITIIDKESFDAVHAAQMKLKEARLKIQKTGKDLREEAIVFQRKVIAVEKDLLAPIASIEEKLKQKKEDYNADIERKKNEEKEKKQKLILERSIALARLDITFDPLVHGTQDEQAFSAYLASKEEEARKNREKIEKEEQERKEKAEKQALELAEAQKKIDEEKRKIEEEKRKIEEEKAKAEKEKLEKEKLEKERIEAEKKEQERIEEKKKKYLAFLLSIGYTKENQEEYTYIDTQETRIFYKKIGVYKK